VKPSPSYVTANRGAPGHSVPRASSVLIADVFTVPDGRVGEDIVVAVALSPDMTASHRELRCWMLDRLSPYKVPRRNWMAEFLPRTRTGEVQRGALADRFLTQARPRSTDA
jgi:acyl-CoA synthetase (AMP-forming)/AMP-acid ligase II